MRTLVLGSGGREHALIYKLGGEMYVAPGNAGTANEDNVENVELKSFEDIADFIASKNIDLVIPGSENILVQDEGIVNFLADKGYDRVFGPTKEAAQLEASKIFSYELMKRCGINQAEGIPCYTQAEAETAISKMCSEDGVVVKLDGLAGGKGVYVYDTVDEAQKKLEEIVNGYKEFSALLISERLEGPEFSVFAITDGYRVVPFTPSFQDHKRLFEGDEGPNTGGMGAYGPAPIADAETVDYVVNQMMEPVVRQMNEDGVPFKGFLYAGVMKTGRRKADLKIIEYNVRFGDPECQPAMMLLKSSLYRSMDAALTGNMTGLKLEFKPGYAMCVVLASQGYAIGDVKKGIPIRGLMEVGQDFNLKIFHAGTKRNKRGSLVTDGGRVLGVTAYSTSLRSVRDRIYEAIEKIDIEGGWNYRRDIGWRALSE